MALPSGETMPTTATACETEFLRYLDHYCTSPSKAGGIDIDRGWATAAQARTDHARQLATRLGVGGYAELDAVAVPLQQAGFIGTSTKPRAMLRIWITSAGRQHVRTVAASPAPPQQFPPLGNPYHAGWLEATFALAALVTALAVVGFSLFMLARNQRFADPSLVVIARTIVSLAVAVLGATVPGFLQVGLKWKGLLIRAGGALALFVITYFFSPQAMPIPFPEDQLNRIEEQGNTTTKLLASVHDDLPARLELANQPLRTLHIKWTFHDAPLLARNLVNKGLSSAGQAMFQYQDLEDINADFDWMQCQRVLERSHALYPWLNYLATGKFEARPVLLLIPLDSSGSVMLPFGQLIGREVLEEATTADERNVAGGIEFQEETDIRRLNPKERKRDCITGFTGTIFVEDNDVTCWWSIPASSLKKMLDMTSRTDPVHAGFPARIQVVLISKIKDWPVQIDDVTVQEYWYNSDVLDPRPVAPAFAGNSELVLTPNNTKHATRYTMKLLRARETITWSISSCSSCMFVR